MGHPGVAEAAVVPVEHPKWAERPLAVVVLKAKQASDARRVDRVLAPSFAKWWLPENVEFVSEIPRRTSAGKFLKSALREKYSRLLQDQRCQAGAGEKQQADSLKAVQRVLRMNRISWSPTLPRPLAETADRGGAFSKVRVAAANWPATGR